MGLAVISTDCPHGPSEIITDKVNGLLVPSGDEGRLTSAVRLLYEDPNLREILSTNGRIRAEDFSADNIAKQFSVYFDEII